MSHQMEPIAIVGMECVFPGAPNVAAFWRNIVRGTSSLTPVPPDRWNRVGDRDLPHVPGGFIDGFTGAVPGALRDRRGAPQHAQRARAAWKFDHIT